VRNVDFLEQADYLPSDGFRYAIAPAEVRLGSETNSRRQAVANDVDDQVAGNLTGALVCHVDLSRGTEPRHKHQRLVDSLSIGVPFVHEEKSPRFVMISRVERSQRSRSAVELTRQECRYERLWRTPGRDKIGERVETLGDHPQYVAIGSESDMGQ
jgi:hypothetical protein